MEEFDCIIVGAGSSGCVLAYRLSADESKRVLLIEAGGEDTAPIITIPKGFAKVIRDPQATITLRAYAPQQIFVDGWVTNPGLVRSDVPLTVSRALAQAGGTKSGAHTDAILVLRRTADNKIHYYQVALGNYAGAGFSAEDPLLSSYDVVYVPQTIFASLQDFLVNYVKNVPFYVNYQIQ